MMRALERLARRAARFLLRALRAVRRRLRAATSGALGAVRTVHARGRLLLSTTALLARAAVRTLLPPSRPSGSAADPAAAPSLGRKPRLLVVCPCSLIPVCHGGATRIVNLLKQLAERYDLHVFTFTHTSDDPAQRQALEPWCKSVIVHRRENVEPPRPWDLDPRSVQFFASQAVRERLADLVHRERIDVVQLEFTELAQYAEIAGDAKVVLIEHDLCFVSSLRRRAVGFHHRFETDRQLWSSVVDWMRLLRYEVRRCERVDQIHVMSERDGEILARFLSDGWRRIKVIPNGVEVPAQPPPDVAARNRKVLFVGYFGHSPNLDAVHYLVREVWPLVRARRPDAELTVVGANPPASVIALGGREGVAVVGTVPSPRPYCRDHRLLAAPLRAGSGTRLKILDAFAEGLPVVTTAVGAEGLEVRDGEHLLLAENPAEHAAAIVRLLDDDVLHRRLALAARELVAARYSWQSVAERAHAAYAEVLTGVLAEPANDVETWPVPVPGSAPLAPPEVVEITVVIATLDGGARLEQCLGALAAQRTEARFEVVCVDAGSCETELERFRRFGVRCVCTPGRSLDDGAKRDLGARHGRGKVLAFLDQDAVPSDRGWLHALCDPLLRPGPWAAVLGAIHERPGSPARFSMANAALRREVWEQVPFGWIAAGDSEKWQRQAQRAGLGIARCPQAAVCQPRSPAALGFAARGVERLRRCLLYSPPLMSIFRKSSPPPAEAPPDPRLAQRGWLDSPVVLVEHASPLIARGRSDRNWLLDLFAQLPIERQGHWLSLGCGGGSQELWGLEKGLFASVDGFDASAGAIEAARAAAQKANVGTARFETADLETLELEPGRYGGALAAMTLFRVVDLDRLLAQVAASLEPGGWFLVNEYVGPAQFQFTDHQLQIVEEVLALLPDRLRFDYVQGFVKQVYHRRPKAFWDEVAPREAISSEKIAPALERHFERVERRDYGGTLLNPLLENVVGNFATGSEEDLAILRLLAYLERLLLREGRLSSDFAVFVARKRS